jgi:hypothetical protein
MTSFVMIRRLSLGGVEGLSWPPPLQQHGWKEAQAALDSHCLVHSFQRSLGNSKATLRFTSKTADLSLLL